MKKILSILLILAMALSFTVMAFAEEKKDDPDLKTFGEGQGHRRRSV